MPLLPVSMVSHAHGYQALGIGAAWVILVVLFTLTYAVFSSSNGRTKFIVGASVIGSMIVSNFLIAFIYRLYETFPSHIGFLILMVSPFAGAYIGARISKRKP